MADITIDALTSGDLRMGSLEVRLAETKAEVEAAQAIRYRVFYEEMEAQATPEMARLRRDFDDFDPLCDHLLVIDHAQGAGAAGVVGTYRLIRRAAAARAGSFYSSDEYDISRLEEYRGEILELGRSCVDAAYRSRHAMQLLWRGIAAYVAVYDIHLLFGCASLPGTDPKALALPLSYLHYHHLAPPALRPVALPHRYVDMRLMAEHDVDARRGLALVPPLIKGYLRLGGFVGDGAVVDHQFNTTDVSIVVKTDMITDKYLRHYERRGSALI
ncbi:GNAT family N-acyltransferase [Nitrospirillum sp. BR 11752]|uniref:L-ornithine N(alpha)-acyltransferase n=1 Tax=Nitrospirillum amazonense TaxID=28077 RepID=A0A560GS21_9PROT|nr:GNAT family N-acyltransferase [Nitrospirillum amazonense]MEE3626242.1 GNAT family N-acyltransferase [Nitrospirillum sp. BR 11752]TWB36827.1 putative hemolysin [Nitrospirillum amazonense]